MSHQEKFLDSVRFLLGLQCVAHFVLALQWSKTLIAHIVNPEKRLGSFALTTRSGGRLKDF